MSQSSSNGTDGFDPVAYAERWYEEHPRAWERFSQALARQIEEDIGGAQSKSVLRDPLVSIQRLERLRAVQKAQAELMVQHRTDSVLGRKLMELEEAQIIAGAKQFGREVRELEDQGLELERTQKRREWTDFRNQFKGAQRTLAVESYYIEYCR